MNKLDTSYLKKCNRALESSFRKLQGYSENDIEHEIYRSAVIKEFEIILEQSGKLLKKPYVRTSTAIKQQINWFSKNYLGMQACTP